MVFFCAKPINFHIEQNIKISYEKELLRNLSQYRRLVEYLLYLTIIRPSITYSINLSSRFMHVPYKPQVALPVLQYLEKKKKLGQDFFFFLLRMIYLCESFIILISKVAQHLIYFLGSSLIS